MILVQYDAFAKDSRIYIIEGEQVTGVYKVFTSLPDLTAELIKKCNELGDPRVKVSAPDHIVEEIYRLTNLEVEGV